MCEASCLDNPPFIETDDFDRLPVQQRNMARLVFLEESWRERYDDWDTKADDVVGYLRIA